MFTVLPMMNITFFSASSVKIAPGAVVCVESEIRGDVTIGKSLLVLLLKNW